MNTLLKKLKGNNGVIIGQPENGQKHVYEPQHNDASLVHFAYAMYKCIELEFIHLFLPFCGTPNYPVFLLRTF